MGPMMKNSSPLCFSMDSRPQREGLTEGMGDTTGTRGVKETPRIKSEASRLSSRRSKWKTDTFTS